MWYQNIGSMFFRFVTKHACDGQTDRQTERTYTQNYDAQDHASIYASGGKNSVVEVEKYDDSRPYYQNSSQLVNQPIAVNIRVHY